MKTVWIEFWQQQCCGKPFGVGSPIQWGVDVVPAGVEALQRIFAPGPEADVQLVENHHGGDDTDAVVSGVVRSLTVVTADFTLRGRRVVLDRGSGRLRQITTCDPWEPDAPAGATWIFLGWLVEVDARAQPRGTPPQPPTR